MDGKLSFQMNQTTHRAARFIGCCRARDVRVRRNTPARYPLADAGCGRDAQWVWKMYPWGKAMLPAVTGRALRCLRVYSIHKILL